MHYHQPRVGTLFSKMMVVIFLLTTAFVISFGPQSSTYEAFGSRTGSASSIQ